MFGLQIRTMVFLGAAGALIAGGIVYLFAQYDPSLWPAFIVNEDTRPIVFIALMASLPIVGFPLSLFLILAGIKFGIFHALLITTFLMPLHLLISFFLANSLLRPYLEALMVRLDHPLPEIPEGRTVLYTALFYAIPVAPYSLKNYLLAMTGTPLRYYLSLGWGIQLTMAVPFIGLGKSAAEMNLGLSLVFMAILGAGYVISRQLKNRLFH